MLKCNSLFTTKNEKRPETSILFRFKTNALFCVNIYFFLELQANRMSYINTPRALATTKIFHFLEEKNSIQRTFGTVTICTKVVASVNIVFFFFTRSLY